MFLGFTNTKISNNNKLLSHNNLSFLEGKFTPLNCQKNIDDKKCYNKVIINWNEENVTTFLSH